MTAEKNTTGEAKKNVRKISKMISAITTTHTSPITHMTFHKNKEKTMTMTCFEATTTLRGSYLELHGPSLTASVTKQHKQ